MSGSDPKDVQLQSREWARSVEFHRNVKGDIPSALKHCDIGV
jgi:hypothetical protein